MNRVLCVGHAVEDYLFRVASLPRTPEKHLAESFEVVGGGPAANAAVAISRLGGEALLAARLGDDPAGASIVAALEADCVNCALVRRFGEARSSVSSVYIDDAGRRQIVNFLDPAMPDAADWLLNDWPSDIDTVLVDVRWPGGAEAALARARKMGAPGVLDADHPIPPDGGLIALASHAAFSAEGLRGFTGEHDLETGLRRIAREVDAWCCVTDGADGVLLAEKDGCVRIPAPAVKAVDTLGAGDIWHGAFALRIAEGAAEREAVEFANAAAAVKVTRPGGRRGAPSRAETVSLLDKKPMEATA
ncbi:MAG: PfkB family carbohydrate kinase [Pseudomonadota bacterium]